MSPYPTSLCRYNNLQGCNESKKNSDPDPNPNEVSCKISDPDPIIDKIYIKHNKTC